MKSLTTILTEQWGMADVRFREHLAAKGQRQVVRFDSSEGQWALKILEPSTNEQRVIHDTLALDFVSQGELAPRVLRTVDNECYVHHEGRFMYLMEYVDGRDLREEPDDEYHLGQATARLHQLIGYDQPSSLNGCNVNRRIREMEGRFHDQPFTTDHDELLKTLRDFTTVCQSFIHTDVGPHNARINRQGSVVFIDLDDAGIGPTCIDVGYPLICQFVRHRSNGELGFDEVNAKAFYQGYLAQSPLDVSERESIFDGAVFMQLMYMDAYGEKGVDPMWGILTYALNNQEVLKRTFL